MSQSPEYLATVERVEVVLREELVRHGALGDWVLVANVTDLHSGTTQLVKLEPPSCLRTASKGLLWTGLHWDMVDDA